MIDTVCLLIPKEEMRYPAGIGRWDLYSKTEIYSKYIRNPSKTEKETGQYFPRLTGYKRMFGQDANIRIEFSVPKLLYLNNLNEVENDDFNEVVNTLIARLKTMGIIVSSNVLERASVSSVDFSRNILIKSGYTVNHLISEINKINLRKSFDFTRSRYINDGQSLYAHTKSHQLVIYDKIADLGKTKSRAIDKDYNVGQRQFFRELDEKEKLKEIIRFEVRLNQKQKMNKILKDLGYKENPTFKDVFDSEISQKIIRSYWEGIILEKNLGLFSLELGAKDILQRILLEVSEIRPNKAIYLLGLILLSRDENGVRQLRAMISKKCSDRTWYRIVNDLNYANEIVAKSGLRDWVIEINENLSRYTPYKTQDDKLGI
jgi:hypothetical protein